MITKVFGCSLPLELYLLLCIHDIVVSTGGYKRHRTAGRFYKEGVSNGKQDVLKGAACLRVQGLAMEGELRTLDQGAFLEKLPMEVDQLQH